MFLPLKDLNPARRTPWVTLALVALNAGAFAYQAFGPLPAEQLFARFALIPNRLLLDGMVSPEFPGSAITFLTSMFLHGDLFHLGGNLLYLWIFGNNVEDVLGHMPFFFFYLGAGLGGHALHLLTNIGSAIPTVGASGAISGVLAAYLIRFPHARIVSLVFLLFFVRSVILPASIVIGVWFAIQVLSGLSSLGAASMGGGVAWFEHVGGFLVGLSLFPLLRPSRAFAR